jgi:hypothetical protein
MKTFPKEKWFNNNIFFIFLATLYDTDFFMCKVFNKLNWVLNENGRNLLPELSKQVWAKGRKSSESEKMTLHLLYFSTWYLFYGWIHTVHRVLFTRGWEGECVWGVGANCANGPRPTNNRQFYTTLNSPPGALRSYPAGFSSVSPNAPPHTAGGKFPFLKEYYSEWYRT